MIYAVSGDRLWARTDDGDIIPIVVWFDGEGEETRVREEAIAAVARQDESHWYSINLTQYEAAAVH